MLELIVNSTIGVSLRIARLHCLNLGVQNWVKTLTDLQCRPFKPYQMQQFTICFHLYLEILQNVEGHLEGEAKLIFEMLGTGDGNDSLKHILRKEQGAFDDDGVPKQGGMERPNPQTANAGGDYYLSREKVDSALSFHGSRFGLTYKEDNLCQERWKNMSEEIMERMWGIFDETGAFLALCCHGFVLLIADMVKSGDWAKYGLAIANSLLDAFSPDFGFGYDISCGFKATIKNSLLRPKAKKLNFKMLVSSFHGHAHNRMCQLRYLATYVLGLGLEDLKGYERTVRYASVFHRKQSITTYLAHVDSFQTYSNLSKFLVDNYKQALDILDMEEVLTFAMDQAGISGSGGDEFWRRLEEKAYLRSLSKESEEETQQMEYYQNLVNLQACKKTFNNVFVEGSTANGTAKRHAQDNYDKAHAAIQGMEQVLEITTWKITALMVSTRHYRLCVNKLEELVLKRLFELTKMNMSQTGYKLRKHIAKVLQVRSKTIHAALSRYNAAATGLTPKHRSLTWPEVIEYVFLLDFDTLRDPTCNADLWEWATPAARQLMDSFFRLEHTKEEIPWLNIKIRCLVTYIRDEKALLLRKEAEVRETDPNLAYFIGKYCNHWGRSDDSHMVRLQAMAKNITLPPLGFNRFSCMK
ncbi:hypothetical protein B0H17DRAFT_1159135 [Mycena rosella]|uniref:Uncharacterized protein n=1 Tax=Mycena rosella TaxID=1033263 RepID=A0AAD7GH90_MYCRO|nr:hypothetical protein B0H17DRAFT_1159135 [Mycena rosella]